MAKDRIIRYRMRSWKVVFGVEVRNIMVTRPSQHFLEPLVGYLQLGSALSIVSSLNGEAFNSGSSEDDEPSVLGILKAFETLLPGFKWTDMSTDYQSLSASELKLLRVNCDKVRHLLGWHAILGFEETLDLTAEWDIGYYEVTSSIG